MEPGSDHHCHCEERSDVAISWYYLYYCIALPGIVPGDCHGPKVPRNDTVVVTQVRSRCCAKQQFIFLALSNFACYNKITKLWRFL